ncbi:MAG: exo-alpha-sialidase [Pirellulaceae bacterium]|nr:exo-alpha-sialidase [Pirellulaceae bacterium]
MPAQQKVRLIQIMMKHLLILWVLAAHLFVVDLASIGVEPGAISVKNVRRVFYDGEHNAFTDLIRWRDKYWLTFRSCPDGHGVSSTASILILSSTDAKTWTPSHRFSVPQRDTRDPHFLAFKDRLFVYSGTWFAGDGPLPREKYNLDQHLGYAVSTGDGTIWQGPRQLEGTFGHYVWRAASHGDKAYLCGRRAYTGGRQSALLESDDGLVWKFRSLFQETQGNETAFMIDPDGLLTALCRKTAHESDLIRSRPPYEQWTRLTLPEFVGGPLLVRWGDRVLVGGRHVTTAGPHTRLSWLIDDKLVPCAELPSGGDNSYPGFVAIDDRHALVSWYSSHEKSANGKPETAIYLADLVRHD